MPLAAVFDLVRDIPFIRGLVAIVLGWSFIYFARAAFYRPSPLTTTRDWIDRGAYWFGRIIGSMILVLGVIAVGLDTVLALLG